MTEKRIFSLLDGLTTEDLVGQVLCYDIYDKDDPAQVEKIVREIRPGGIFVTGMSAEKIKMYRDMVNKYVKIPVVVSADIEFGVGCAVKGYPVLPHPMAWGACRDENLIRKAGELTGALCRKCGIHWSFAPVVDINYNKNNPVVNIRSVSDSPELVANIASAYSIGLQKNGYMVAGAKHFPGDGVDDRNQHFCTSENSFSRRKWMMTYGKVYRRMIESGVGSIMVAHISLPSYQEGESEVSLPGVLSRKLMSELLRGKLKFRGCIVSDAMSMVGACSRTEPEKLAVNFLKAGGDMVLFPEKTDYRSILQALEDGELEKDRLLDAVARILRLKDSARLFEDQSVIEQELSCVNEQEYMQVAQEIADKSIKIVRNGGNLPCQFNQIKKVLLLNLAGVHSKQNNADVFAPLEQELKSRGLQVESLWNTSHYEVEKRLNDYDLVLINAKFVPADFTSGSSLRIGWDNIMTFWRGYVLKHKNLVFVSFGDPYKLYELPFLKTYINCFSFSEFSQRALVKTIFGEIQPVAKNPIGMEPYFRFGE